MENESMNWSEYLKLKEPQWQKILNDIHTQEIDVQKFFEENPCMVPGAFGFINPSGHHPYPGALISQPCLPEFTSKFPDFMWISINSGEIRPVLIEIESPNKKYFNKNGSYTKVFEDALAQLDEWQIWFDRDNNKQRFKDYYKIPPNKYIRLVKPFYVLIYGRRSELKFKNSIEKRAIKEKDNKIIMTFDRLKPQKDCSDYITIKLKNNGYEAISVPPTFRIILSIIGYLKEIVGIESVIESNKYIVENRKDYLINYLKSYKNHNDDKPFIISMSGSKI